MFASPPIVLDQSLRGENEPETTQSTARFVSKDQRCIHRVLEPPLDHSAFESYSRHRIAPVVRALQEPKHELNKRALGLWARSMEHESKEETQCYTSSLDARSHPLLF